MARKKQACIVESDEEDVDGNLAEISPEASDEDEDGNLAEISPEASDEDEDGNLAEISPEASDEDEDGNLAELNSEISDEEDENLDEEDSDKSEISPEGEVVYLPEDSSGLQPEEEDLTERKVPVSYLTSDSDDSDCSDKNVQKNYAQQATPLCDDIMKGFVKFKPTRGGAPNASSVPNPELNNISNTKETPASQSSSTNQNNITEDSTVDDPLLIKLKEEVDIKPEVCTEKQENLLDQEDLKNPTELKPLTIIDAPPELLTLARCQVNLGQKLTLTELEELSQNNKQNIRREKKSEEDNDPTYFPSIEEPSTCIEVESDQQEAMCAPVETARVQTTEQVVSVKRKRGRPPKFKEFLLKEPNSKSQKNLASDSAGTSKQGESSYVNETSPGLVGTLDSATPTNKGVLISNKDLIVKTNLNKMSSEHKLSSNTQPTTNVSRKRGRPLKTAEPIENKKKMTTMSAEQSKQFNETVQTPSTEIPEVSSIAVHLRSLADKIASLLESETDPDIGEDAENLLNTTQELLRLQKQKTQKSYELEESSHSSNSNTITDINRVVETPIEISTKLWSQKLDASETPSLDLNETGLMSSDDESTFLTDYLTSYHNVFDDSFFKTILPALSEILLLCMDEFIELLERNKKAANISCEELQKQEIELIKQSFCKMVSKYNRNFFPNFNSVLYKIDHNKVKKWMIISLIFFMSHSLCIKSSKFKGMLHRVRQLLIYMCKIAGQSNSLFYTVLSTSDNSFNEELRLLVKIWLILQKKKLLSIPSNALSVNDSSGTIKEMCELIMSSCTSYSCGIRSLKQPERTKASNTSNLSDVEVELNGLMSSKYNIFSPDQEDNKLALDEMFNLTDVGLDCLLQSYLVSTGNVIETVKSEPVDGLQTESSEANNIQSSLPDVKIEEVDCTADFDSSENELLNGTSTAARTNRFISRSVDQDPLSF